MTAEVPAQVDTETEGHLKRVLGVPALVLFGLVNMVPLTVFTTLGIVTQLTGGRLSVAGLIWLAVGFVWLLIMTRGFQRPTPVLDLEE